MTQSGSTLLLESGPLLLEVLPAWAGRVGGLFYRGQPLLTDKTVHPTNWGSTYWTSPQAAWGWPPVAAIDSEPFEKVGETPLTLRGPVAEIGASRLRLEKKYQPRPELGAFDFAFTLENMGSTAAQAASWQISRTPGGLTFFPTGERELTPIAPHGALELQRLEGVSFYEHSNFVLGRSLKVHADGREGFLAHVIGSGLDDSLLFMKLWRDTRADEQAPLEGEVELFANEDGKYVEIEVQGPYEHLPPQGRSTFCVRWVVRPVPPSIRVEVGSAELVAFARSVAREVGPPELEG